MTVIVRIVAVLMALALLAVGGLWLLGSGRLGEHWGPGSVTPTAVPDEVLGLRALTQLDSALKASAPFRKQILFGDLHVHSTYSVDAFLMSLPAAGGDGANPVADACDFARYCSSLDFWSINDHAIGLTPRRWRETVDSIRQCNAVASNPEQPDVTAFLGWEWTQVGTTAEDHYGHKNVVLRYIDEERIPTRPIAAASRALQAQQGSGPRTLGLGLVALFQGRVGVDVARYLQELAAVPACPDGVAERELPNDCREFAATPEELAAKLDDWGHDALVIPHGTTWGYYTPLGSSWDKQLTAAAHDPERQRLIEVYSGHGNSEEYREFREVIFDADGGRSCPEPEANHLPSCWRAGEIIRERCRAAGESDETCDARAVAARQNYVDADISGHLTIAGATVEDWLDAGQCRDCFLPSFNYRPQSSVQYIMALRSFDGAAPARFRFGFTASSDVHSARPGTGYKEYARTVTTEARFATFGEGALGGGAPSSEPRPESQAFDPAQSSAGFFGLRETERGASFFLTGGLVAAHTTGRTRDDIWDALQRREVYGTSGPRMLLWFDLVNGPAGARLPMGSDVVMEANPTFEVRAVGSLEQQPGCAAWAGNALSPERLERLCRGECYHPSDTRRPISRVEVVRIRPRAEPAEPIGELVDDPWRVYRCEPDPVGCRITFTDPEFVAAGRDVVYYVRAIEVPSLAVDASPLGCEYDAEGNCVQVHPCARRPVEDDCLDEVEERAWSSPIFVDHFEAAG